MHTFINKRFCELMRPGVMLDVFPLWKRKQFRTGRSLIIDCIKEHTDPVPTEADSLNLVHGTHKILGTVAL